MKLWDRLTGKVEAECKADCEQRLEALRESHANEMNEILSLAFDNGLLFFKEHDYVDVPELGDTHVRRIVGAWRWAARPTQGNSF